MREIKFRGRTSGSNEWVYGSYQADVMHQGTHTIMYCDYEGYYMEDGVDPETVGQYTGLNDKTGKDIYEGDIVTYNNFNSLRTGGHAEDRIIVGKVAFDSGMWIVESIDYSQDLYEAHVNDEELLVIGNIYENPELLK